MVGYLLGCLLAGLWVTAWIGGAPPDVDLQSYEQIPPTFGDHVGMAAFLACVALVGCLLPVAIGRVVIWALNLSGPGWHALIWAMAGGLVAGGLDFGSWASIDLWLGFILPGACIGLVVHRAETWKQG